MSTSNLAAATSSLWRVMVPTEMIAGSRKSGVAALVSATWAPAAGRTDKSANASPSASNAMPFRCCSGASAPSARLRGLRGAGVGARRLLVVAAGRAAGHAESGGEQGGEDE